MAEFGELCLWAAAPLAALGAAASIGGGLSGRARLAVLGGRAAEATAFLLLLALVGLGYALVVVKLKYAYVAGYSGFQHSWPWRLAALWSGPAGGASILTFLVAVAAAVSYRLDQTRQAAARTGTLAVLVLVGLLILARARPFAQLAVPAVAGEGLPLAVRDAAWQIAAWATYLAVSCAALVFAGVIGEQLALARGRQRRERRAVSLAAGFLTVAVLSATWGVYARGGRFLDPTALSNVVVHVPALLLAYSCVHAPGGAAAPAWAWRWRRIIGVALFPAALGGVASLLAGSGTMPPTTPWAAGLAVGIVSGAMAGMAGRRARRSGIEGVPGFGLFALLGGLLTLVMAGVVAVWVPLRGSVPGYVAWPLPLVGVAAMAAWSLRLPAGRWNRVWPLGALLAVSAAVAAYWLSGWRAPGFALAGGLTVGVLAGFAADMIRLRAARRALSAMGSGELSPAVRARAGRRRASALAHLGAALVVLGLSATALNRTALRTLNPGDTFSLPGRLGSGIEVTYLGFSRYRVDDLERQVASFRLARGDRAARLITASHSFEWPRRTESLTPAVERGLVRDVIVDFRSHRRSEAIDCRLSVRLLASLVWSGGILLLISFLVRGRPLV
ncbi:MAG: hypothetical protein JSV86_00070 [Gemmatimonadota bacterium]|nr:MAG: hypothetical protein JSV86_00070 [Gemmatimonadota bacterium]